ncbi:MAG: hypothetical protein ACKVUT_16110 [Gaiella sp.]
MPAALPASRLDVGARGREHPLPGPLATGRRQLAAQRVREVDPSGTVVEVAAVLRAHAFEVGGELGSNRHRKQRRPVSVALATSHVDLMPREVDVLQ